MRDVNTTSLCLARRSVEGIKSPRGAGTVAFNKGTCSSIKVLLQGYAFERNLGRGIPGS